MKILTSFLLASFLSFFSLSAYSQITDVTLEPYMVHTGVYDDGVDLTGFTTWRVYVHFENPEDVLSAVYGFENGSDISISTTTSFFQHEFAGSTTNNNNCMFWDILPSMQWDSFFTINNESSCGGNDVFFVTSIPGIVEVVNAFEGPANGDYFDGGNVLIDDGTWFTVNDGVNGVAGDDLKVLAAQLTTDGDVTFCASFQAFAMGDGTNVSNVTVCLDSNAWGCMDSEACNYNPNIEEDVDVCVYSPSVEGVVFQDDNLDGVFQIQNFEEMGVPNIVVTLNELGLMTFTDAVGNFEFTNVPEGDYTFSIGLPNESWMLTSGSEISVAVGPCVNQLDNIGVVEGWGCTDSMACNYNSIADIDYDSCVYDPWISGTVFFDANSDGLLDPFSSLEYPLENFQVTLNELGLIVFTDIDGTFMFPEIPEGGYTLTFGSEGEGWVLTTTTASDIGVGPCVNSTGEVGVVPLEGTEFWVAGLSNILSPDLHCTDGMDAGLFIQNLGSAPLNGTLTLTFDPFLTAVNGMTNGVDPDNISSGEVVWNLADTPDPGELLVFSCHILGPGADYFGEEFPMTINLSLVDDSGVEFYSNDWDFVPTVVCSYDPNDKYSEYPGYTDEHFVLAEDEIEYRIRFQNIGNYPALNVLIQDTLDTEFLDLSTFYPAYSSHGMMTCLQPNGALEFVFNNINLPDSTANEAESHGFVVYRVTPKTTVQAGDMIYNTAYITFDDNPAMATNTTWHTIMECGGEAAFDLSDTEFCAGDVVLVNPTSPYADMLEWTIDGAVVSADQTLSLNLEVGLYEVGLTASNELCSATSSITVEALAVPEALITSDGMIWDVQATEGVAWQWYSNGIPIDGATEQGINIFESGSYTVEVFNEVGCSALSDPVTILSIDNGLVGELLLYPNPMSEYCILKIPEELKEVYLTIFDSRARVVQSTKHVPSGDYMLTRDDLSSGIYGIQIRSSVGLYTLKLIVN